MNPEDITSLDELIDWISGNITSPKNPPLTGAELNIILIKIIQFRNVPDPHLVFINPTLGGSDGNYTFSFNLPSGKEIASISTRQGTLTKRIPISLADTDTANDPNTIVGGFDNNSAQTIIIKVI